MRMFPSAYSFSLFPNLMRLLLLAFTVSCVAGQVTGPDVQWCNESFVLNQECHFLAECVKSTGCTCPRGTIDGMETEGKQCVLTSWVSRVVVEWNTGDFDPAVVLPLWGELLANAADAVTDCTVGTMRLYCDATYLADHAVYQVTTVGGKDVVTLSGLFKDSTLAGQISDKLTELHGENIATELGATRRVWGPKKYSFYTPTTSAYYTVGPSGLEVDDVFFEPNCLNTGCWVVDITYSVGDDESMNVLYLPLATGGAYDLSTNDPLNFPCGSNQWDGETKVAQTACCMPYFLDEFRVPEAFQEWLNAQPLACPTTSSSDEDVTDVDWTDKTIYGTPGDTQGFPTFPGNFIATAPSSAEDKPGKFVGMDQSWVQYTGVVDYTLGIHQARLFLDEHEARELAAHREGTLEVQYTLDLYVGIAEFSPTSTMVLDSAMKQVAIHLEKSDFFTVSQHSTVGPGPPGWCCGLGCVPAIDSEGRNLGYEYCPPEKIGANFEGCVNVEGPFEAGEDPCSSCSPGEPDCVLTPLECQDFWYQGKFYVFPKNYTDPPVEGNVSSVTQGCCVQVSSDDNGPLYYPPECNTRNPAGCERIYVRGVTNEKYPNYLLGIVNRSLWPEEFNTTYIECCEVSWAEQFGRDCERMKGANPRARQKQRDLYWQCRDDLDAFVTDKCFKCPEGMSECDCGRTSCGGSDPVSNFAVRLNEVLDPANPANPALQYLQVSFTTGAQYSPAPANGAVALSSVLVAKNDFYETAAFQQACAGANNIYDDTQAAYNELWQEACAPDNMVCQRVDSIQDNFVSFNVPLGAGFFSASDYTLTGELNVYVEFVVTLNKAPDASTFATLVKLSYPLVPGGTNTWCKAQEAQTDLQQVANVHLLVGSAMTAAELDRLMLFENIAGSVLDPASATEFDTASIESGLMTLIIEGDSDYFSLPVASTYTLELEDVVTLHFIDNGGSAWADLVALVGSQDNAGAAFTVETDRWGHHAHLEPTEELKAICPFSARRPTMTTIIPSVCIARRDMQARTPVAVPGADKTAIELTAATLDEAVDFMETILGESDYTNRLARNFSDIVRDHWNVNEKWIRAFWVNPAYEWSPGSANRANLDRFSLSQNLVMFCLINLNENFRRSLDQQEPDPAVAVGRRTLLAAGAEDPRNGMGGASLSFPISATDIVCQALDCDMDAMTVWQVQFQLTEEETCFSKQALNDLFRGKLKRTIKLSESTSGYESVQIVDIVVDPQGVRCSGSRRLLQSTGGTAVANTMILFEDTTATISVDEIIAAAEGEILAMKTSETAPAGITVVSTGRTPNNNNGGGNGNADAPLAEGEDDDDSHRQTTYIMAAVFGVAGVALMGVAAVVAWKMKYEEEEPVTVVEALTTQEFKEQTGTAPLSTTPEF